MSGALYAMFWFAAAAATVFGAWAIHESNRPLVALAGLLSALVMGAGLYTAAPLYPQWFASGLRVVLPAEPVASSACAPPTLPFADH